MALDVSWLRARAEGCLLTAHECDRRAASFWVWLTGQRPWWIREAAWWRMQCVEWNHLADELEQSATSKETLR